VPLLGTTVLRVGRQELDSGGNRLISTRYAGNLRLAFDMAHLESRFSGFDAVAFYGRPVLNQRGAFDDRGNPTEKLLGGWVQRALGSDPGAPTINVFFLSRDRNRAVYERGVAFDNRRTIGLRASGAAPRWDYARGVLPVRLVRLRRYLGGRCRGRCGLASGHLRTLAHCGIHPRSCGDDHYAGGSMLLTCADVVP
jgi:hypothetical protein